MKLIYCANCGDVVRLTRQKQFCQCGESGGQYLDSLHAEYFGHWSFPLGVDNHSFRAAIVEQPEQGAGKEFKAFVIPQTCTTFKKV